MLSVYSEAKQTNILIKKEKKNHDLGHSKVGYFAEKLGVQLFT